MYAVQMSVVASDAFLTIKKDSVSLADFKWAIFSLNDILIESIWLGNNGETFSENSSENFFASTSRSTVDKKHFVENSWFQNLI